MATFLGLVALRAKTDKIQERYLTSRLKAEMLRREYFLFLGRLGPYGEIDRLQHLIRQVAKIRAGKGGATHG